MSMPFIAEIKIFGPNLAPRGWAFCDGQVIPNSQNPKLFQLLGYTYGGDGSTRFALPDLRGRVPVHTGNGLNLGKPGGETAHVLSTDEMPGHNHLPMANETLADQGSPSGNFWATQAGSAYASVNDQAMASAAISPTGGGQPHQNMSPYLVLTFIIALQGIYPSRP